MAGQTDNRMEKRPQRWTGTPRARGEMCPPRETKAQRRIRNQNATTPENRWGTTDSRGRSTPAAGLEPATRRLTAVCSTN